MHIIPKFIISLKDFNMKNQSPNQHRPLMGLMTQITTTTTTTKYSKNQGRKEYFLLFFPSENPFQIYETP